MISDPYVICSCDNPKCSSTEEQHDGTDREIESRLTRSGWICEEGSHYCQKECYQEAHSEP